MGELYNDERGASTAECIVLCCLIALVPLVAWKTFGAEVEEKTSQAETSIQALVVDSTSPQTAALLPGAG